MYVVQTSPRSAFTYTVLVLASESDARWVKYSVLPARWTSSAPLSSFERPQTSYPPKLPHVACQLIHLLCLLHRRAVQKLRHVSRMPWSKMHHRQPLSSGVSEGILPFWIVIHWLIQKIYLPRCELFIGAQRRAFDLVHTLTEASERLARCSFHPGACSWGVEVLCCTPLRLRFFSDSNIYFSFTSLYAKLNKETHTFGSLSCIVLAPDS
jgi:hypothetical protein